LAGLRECALAAADALESARDELCRLDSPAGDGDHGVTMALAARAVRKSLDDAPDASGADFLTRVAIAAGSVGGASGPLYASALLAAGRTLREADPSLAGVPLIARCAEAAQDAIANLGGARPGDKTILDALEPAARSLLATSHADVADALADAAAAAREGAAATAQMTAAVGRARALGERSRGFADPGATSLAIIVGAAASACRARPPR
jgi:phosphoenolpyruvate---glycerone phosphotransferase subunit DhaL